MVLNTSRAEHESDEDVEVGSTSRKKKEEQMSGGEK